MGEINDVIIIGAGPAGSTAAKILAENGYKVLLAEKFKMPRYKSCSGQLIKKSLDMVRDYFGEAVPEHTMCAPAKSKGMIFTNDRGRVFRFEQDGLNVWRSSFDKWLADKAADCGAEVVDNTAVIFCEEQSGTVAVTLKGESTYIVQARYVIDCEGVVGVVKRRLLSKKPHNVMTYQTFNEGSADLDSRFFYAFLQPELSGYDAWFNVKDNMLVLGVAVKDGENVGHYYSRFISYMKEKHGLKITKQLKTDKWIMPYIRPGCNIDYGIGRILFAGETAGFLNPMGEGISSAIESGYHAAKAIMRDFDKPESVLENYRTNTEALRGYMIRQWNFVAGITDTFKEMKL